MSKKFCSVCPLVSSTEVPPCQNGIYKIKCPQFQWGFGTAFVVSIIFYIGYLLV